MPDLLTAAHPRERHGRANRQSLRLHATRIRISLQRLESGTALLQQHFARRARPVGRPRRAALHRGRAVADFAHRAGATTGLAVHAGERGVHQADDAFAAERYGCGHVREERGAAAVGEESETLDLGGELRVVDVVLLDVYAQDVFGWDVY